MDIIARGIALGAKLSAMTYSTAASVSAANAAASAVAAAPYGPVSFGPITAPTGFVPTLPCTFIRGVNGQITHNFNFSQYTGGTVLYVNLDTGSDTTGTGTSSLPYQTITKAVAIAIANTPTSYCIRVQNTSVFKRDQAWNASGVTITNQTIAIIPDVSTNMITMSYGQTGLTWTATGTAWKATRSVVYAVYDLSSKDAYGNYIPYTCVSSLALCQATTGTWYTDGTYVYVNTISGLVPTDSTFVIGINGANILAIMMGTGKLYMQNCILLESRSSDGFQARGDMTGATVCGEFCANNCTFIGGNLLSSLNGTVYTGVVGNALATQDCQKSYFFNCTAAYSMRDGFNHHYADVPTGSRSACLALEYNCLSYNNGWTSPDTVDNNAFTAHEGASVFRVGCIGFNTRGPIMEDVNGCFTVAIDCRCRDNQGIDAAFGFGNDTSGGTVYLINCDAGGNVTYDLNIGIANATCYIRGFRGKRINNLGTITYLS